MAAILCLALLLAGALLLKAIRHTPQRHLPDKPPAGASPAAQVDEPSVEPDRSARPTGREPNAGALDQTSDEADKTDGPQNRSRSSQPPQASETPAASAPTQAASDSTAPVEADAQPPWGEILQPDSEPVSHADICFETFDLRQAVPQAEDIRKWFSPVEGSKLHVGNLPTRLGQCALFEGLMRLDAPWVDQAVLRLSLENYDRVKLHFFHGGRGISLVYYERDRYRWAAYKTTRAANGALPASYVLAATDQGRCQRSEMRHGGPLDIYYRHGTLILSRGDIVLLGAPLEGPPKDIYFQGRAQFQGIRMFRSKAVPRQHPSPPPAEDRRCAEMEWLEHLPAESKFVRRADGAVELVADKPRQPGWVTTPLPEKCLHQLILEVEEATPGTGIFLARGNGPPTEILRFMRNTRDGRLCVGLRGDDSHQSDFGSVDQRLVPLAGRRQWLRLMFGCGSLRWWMSSDGVHWAVAQLPPVNLSGPVTHLGLHHVAQVKTQIRLRRVQLRPLQQLLALAPVEPAPSGVALPRAANLAQWTTHVNQQRPSDHSGKDWQRACALRTLAAGCGRTLGNDLVRLLLDEAANSGLDLDHQLQLLQEAALVMDLQDDQASLMQFVSRFHRLGETAYQQQNLRPFSRIRRALMEAPILSRYSFLPAHEKNIRIELLQLIHQRQWPEVLQFARTLRFFQQHQRVPLLPWAEAMARAQMPEQTATSTPQRQQPDWQPPIVEDLSKDVFNVLAELQAVVDGKDYQEAARIITAVDRESLRGVAPDARDPQLLISLPAALQQAIGNTPPLRSVIQKEFAALADLRVREAIAHSNLPAVRLAAVQFASSDAAAEAHQWLGDQALQAGWFSQAVVEYRRAMDSSNAARQSQLNARIRLAAAMMGQQAGEVPTGTVTLGEVTLSAADFESLVTEMRQHGKRALRQTRLPSLPVQATPPATEYAPARRGRLDGAVGQNPSQEITRHVNHFRVSWTDRQLAAAVEDNVLFVSNRFHVAAFRIEDGQRLWQTAPLSQQRALRARDWTLVPMRPLITAQRIFVRLLYGHGPQLVCLDKPTGELVWLRQEQQNEQFASDPMLIQGRLVGLTVARDDQGQTVLRLVTIDPDTGEALFQTDLIRLREVWWQRRMCEVAALDDALVASLGGAVLCCDLTGDVRWIRKQVVLPPDEETEWVTQHFQRPILHEGRLLLAQPGVRSLDCLAPETGHLVWSVLVPSLRRVMYVDSQRVVIHTDEGLQGRAFADGRRLWQHAASGLLHAYLGGLDQQLIYCTGVRTKAGQSRFQPQLTWLDVQSGKATFRARLDGLDDPDPRLGPLVYAQGQLWTFFGRGQNDPYRDLVQLQP